MRFLLLLLLVLPYHYWLIGIHVQQRSVVGTECDTALESCGMQWLSQTSAGWMRIAALSWRDVEPVAGQPRFNWPSRKTIQLAVNAGMKTILIVRNVPDWASASPRDDCGPIASTHYGDFADFLNAALTYYGNVTAIELGNEQEIVPGNNTVGCWDDPVAYATMTQVVYPLVKAAHSNVLIFSGGVAYVDEWIHKALQAGMQCDIVSYHAYDFMPFAGNVPKSHTAYLALRAWTNKPIAMTEGALGVGDTFVTPLVRQQQADYFKLMAFYAKYDNLQAMIWWRAEDMADQIPTFNTSMFDATGLPNAIFAAFQKVQ